MLRISGDLWHGLLQAITSSIKLPLLFLATLAIHAPSLHFFYVLFGSQQTILQTIAPILTAIATTAVLLFSLAQITIFFLITSSQYPFFKLLNVVFFTIVWFLGVGFLRQGIRSVTETGDESSARSRRPISVIWALLYGFVGSQMAWTPSPFMGDPTHLICWLGSPAATSMLTCSTACSCSSARTTLVSAWQNPAH